MLHYTQTPNIREPQCRNRPFGSARPAPSRAVVAQACQSGRIQQLQQQQSSRRDILSQLSIALSLQLAGQATAGTQPQVPEVGTYLPPAGVDDLVLFVPDARKTPALRAGTVNPSSPYQFALPPSFRCVWVCQAFKLLDTSCILAQPSFLQAPRGFVRRMLHTTYTPGTFPAQHGSSVVAVSAKCVSFITVVISYCVVHLLAVVRREGKVANILSGKQASYGQAGGPVAHATPFSYWQAWVLLAAGGPCCSKTASWHPDTCSWAHLAHSHPTAAPPAMAEDSAIADCPPAYFESSTPPALHVAIHSQPSPHTHCAVSGNYCQPRCDEPWTEVLFESSSDGKIFVIVSPLVKLTRVKGAAIDEVGSPEGILNR